MGFACAGAARDLGSLCHCVRGFRLAGDAGGCDRSVLRVSGSQAVVVLCADGIGGVSTWQYSALYHWLPRRRNSLAQADFGGALSANSPIV